MFYGCLVYRLHECLEYGGGCVVLQVLYALVVCIAPRTLAVMNIRAFNVLSFGSYCLY